MARHFQNHPKKLLEVVGDYSMVGSRRYDAPGNIRADRFLKASRTNILTDEEFENSKVEKAVRVIVRRPDGKFLCVTDYDDETRLGMPGGRVESGESEEDAALRELWEETGLKADDPHLVSVDLFMGRRVFLFFVNSYDGNLRSSREGKVSWCSASKLLDGFFGEYYSNVFKKLGYL